MSSAAEPPSVDKWARVGGWRCASTPQPYHHHAEVSPMSYPTTGFGTWCNTVDRSSLTVADSIMNALGSADLDDYDVEAIEREYRAAINEALPVRVSLVGDQFYGPAYEADHDWDGELDIKATVDEIDLWPIIERHDRTQA